MEIAKNKLNDIDYYKTYMNDITSYELLNDKETYELFQQYQNGNLDAREKLITKNLRLVVKIAREFKDCDLEVMDLISHGNIGLINAVETYKIDKNNKFSTYAYWCIKNSIISAIYQEGRVIRLPNFIRKELNEYYQTLSLLKQRLLREPTEKELASELKMSLKKVRLLETLTNRIKSIDTDFTEDELDLIYEKKVSNSTEEEVIKDYENKEIIKLLMDTELTDDERMAIIYRYGLVTIEPLNLKSIGKLLYVTPERARQIVISGLKKLALNENIQALAENTHDDEYIEKINIEDSKKRSKKNGNNKRR